jgi:hypothetical protein
VKAKARKRPWLGALIILLFTGFWGIKAIQERNMRERIEAMPMKTVCVGRFLLDVPEHAIVSFGGTRIAGWSVTAYYDESDEEFHTGLEKKEQEIRGQKNEKGWDSLESVTKIETEGIRGKVLVFNREWGYLIQFGKRVDGTSANIRGLARSHGVSFEFKADYLDNEHVPELAQIIKQLHPYSEGEIPTEPGFCFERNLIADPLTAGQNESTVAFISLAEHPDLSIALRTIAGIKPDRTLLQRDAANDTVHEHSWAFHSFRRGERTVHGMRGEELMYRVRERSGVTGHDFEWEAFGKVDSVFTPSLALEMSTGHDRPGQPVQASLSDAEAIALWDKMLASLRVRPTTAVQSPTPSPKPLATRVQAGQPCPVSGWWQCEDGDAELQVQGGARQHFKQGTMMPQAQLLASRSLMQKFIAKHPTFSRAGESTWTLARADTAAPSLGMAELATAAPDKKQDAQ